MAKVLGMHAVDLKPGVNSVEFEEFVSGEVLPLYARVPGQSAYLLKGDQGQRLGKYLVVIEIESPERRDQIYPIVGDEDGISEKFQKALDGTESIWEKFSSLVMEFPDPHFTDYVKLSR